jgi:hypothetical protein
VVLDRKAFVITPFRPPFDEHYSVVIKPALEAKGFSVHRANDIYTPRPVIEDIQESILQADLILCEMTGRSPNVFYELGLAHAIGKPAILVSTTEEDIPFDLRHVRVIHYDTRADGWDKKLRQDIQKAAAAAMVPGNLWPKPLALNTTSSPNPGQKAAAGPMKDQERDPRIVDRPINLGFDGGVEGGFPHGWFNSTGHVSNVSTNYAVRVTERDDMPSGKCLMMFNNIAASGEFGSVMQRFPAGFLAGRAVRFEGELRTNNVSGWAGFWLRADGETTANIVFDNMTGQRVAGTTNWARYVIEAQLPRESAWLNIGVVLGGSGTVWADNLRLLIWSTDRVWVDA